MGLDLILGAIILVAAIRGWFRGFFSQAIRIGGLVACVYVAGPVRDLARPVVADRLTSIGPELLDRLLWWIAAVLSFVLITGVAGALLASYRRKRVQERAVERLPAHRGDQSAGAMLGAAKGAILALILVAGVEAYAPEYLKAGGWVGDQVSTSHLLAWSARYQPADRLWDAPPVQNFVDHVRRMGIRGESEGDGDGDGDGNRDEEDNVAGSKAIAVRRGSDTRPPAPLAIDRPEPRDEIDLDAAMEELQRDLDRIGGPDDSR